jgi:hypothetical protein
VAKGTVPPLAAEAAETQGTCRILSGIDHIELSWYAESVLISQARMPPRGRTSAVAAVPQSHSFRGLVLGNDLAGNADVMTYLGLPERKGLHLRLDIIVQVGDPAIGRDSGASADCLVIQTD